MLRLLLALTLASSLFVQANEETHENHTIEHKKNFFVVKGLYSLSEEVKEGTKTLTSDNGVGFGFDIGRMLSEHFAVELDVAYDHNNIEEDDAGTITHTTGDYYTYAVDLVYIAHANKKWSFEAKVGLEYEDETIKELNIAKGSIGYVYAVAAEYFVTKEYEMVLEYEHASIESTRGSGIFLGIKRGF